MALMLIGNKARSIFKFDIKVSDLVLVLVDGNTVKNEENKMEVMVHNRSVGI